jgi:hypothetical protein
MLFSLISGDPWCWSSFIVRRPARPLSARHSLPPRSAGKVGRRICGVWVCFAHLVMAAEVELVWARYPVVNMRGEVEAERRHWATPQPGRLLYIAVVAMVGLYSLDATLSRTHYFLTAKMVCAGLVSTRKDRLFVGQVLLLLQAHYVVWGRAHRLGFVSRDTPHPAGTATAAMFDLTLARQDGRSTSGGYYCELYLIYSHRTCPSWLLTLTLTRGTGLPSPFLKPAPPFQYRWHYNLTHYFNP